MFFLLSFFLPFLLSHVADRVFLLWPGDRPVPLRWESQVQVTGPPETARLHIISNRERSPRDLHFNAKTQLHSTTSKLQCRTPYAKQLGRQEHNPAHQQRLPKIMIRSQTPQDTQPDVVLSTRKIRSSLIHQNTGTRPSTRKPIQPTEPALATGGRHQKQRQLRICSLRKETPNTVSKAK